MIQYQQQHGWQLCAQPTNPTPDCFSRRWLGEYHVTKGSRLAARVTLDEQSSSTRLADVVESELLLRYLWRSNMRARCPSIHQSKSVKQRSPAQPHVEPKVAVKLAIMHEDCKHHDIAVICKIVNTSVVTFQRHRPIGASVHNTAASGRPQILSR